MLQSSCALPGSRKAAPPPEPEASGVSEENLKLLIDEFTREPHPFLSPAQESYREVLVDRLRRTGWSVEVQTFPAKVPNLESRRFGGTQSNVPDTREGTGGNVIAHLPGTAPCSVLIGGHFDTKFYAQQRFVGANDGGSSTALQVELARILAQRKSASPPPADSLFACDLGLVFFDGEEALLPDWSDGERQLGLKDNLYGSRFFAQSLRVPDDGKPQWQGKPIALALVIDMIGHKNQTLTITNGSHRGYGAKLEELAQDVKISLAPLTVEDDHVPLAQRGVPVVHVIDWTNLSEWHTPKDTPEILSTERMRAFGGLILRFLGSTRLP